MLSLQASMVIEQGDAWQVTGGLHDHGLLACMRWITPANDPQTPKDPSNEPQMILEPNDPHWWAQMIPRGKGPVIIYRLGGGVGGFWAKHDEI